MRPLLRFALITTLAVGLAVPAAAQTPAAPDPAPASSAPARDGADSRASLARLLPDLAADFASLVSREAAWTLAIGGGVALAAHPGDRSLTRRATASLPLDHAFEAGELIGSGWVHSAGAVATYVAGAVAGPGATREIGYDLIRAQLVNAALTQGLKRSVGRRRPDNGRYSFPSGHASGSFATAAVLHRHLGWKAGAPAFGVAAYVAFSRLQENRHFASDVIFGAAVGVLAGRAVTVDLGPSRFAVEPLVVPGGGGVVFTRVTR